MDAGRIIEIVGSVLLVAFILWAAWITNRIRRK